jgi:hypothetical protein
MRLTWKDGAAALLMGAVVVVVLAVTQAWGWPLLGGFRSGAAVLGAVGLGMCIAGPVEGRRHSRVYGRSMAVLGSLAAGLWIWGVVAGSEVVFLALAGVVGAMWLVATVGHALGYGVAPPAAPEEKRTEPAERIAA